MVMVWYVLEIAFVSACDDPDHAALYEATWSGVFFFDVLTLKALCDLGLEEGQVFLKCVSHFYYSQFLSSQCDVVPRKAKAMKKLCISMVANTTS